MTKAKNTPTPTTTTLVVRAVGYRRVSTDKQVQSGAGLDDQGQRIAQLCEAKGWELLDVMTDEGVSGGKAADSRPALRMALAKLAAGEADVLVVPKLDRLARSVGMLAGVLDRAAREGWQVVCTDADIDTTTPAGRLVANVMGSVAEWERAIIAERTRDGMAAKKRAGVRMGRPVQLSAEARQRVAELHASGLSLRAVAAQLATEGVPTATGGQWYASTVRRVLGTIALDAEAEAAKADHDRLVANVMGKVAEWDSMVGA